MTFRLQRVLDLRKRREEEQQARLGAATRARVQAEHRLHALIAEEQRQREGLAALLAGGRVDAGRVQGMGMLLEVAARAIAAQRDEAGRRAAFQEEERVRLTKAMSERKALDRLRERHAERERLDQNRREANVLNETVNARYRGGGS